MIFNRGMALSEIVLDGKRAIRVYLDGQLLWDGTRDVTHTAPTMLGSGTFVLPLITAESPVHVDIMLGAAAMHAPVVRSSVAPAIPRMGGSGKLNGPELHATATVTGIEMATAYGVFLNPLVSEAFDRSVEVPPMVAVGTFMLPAISAEYVAQVQRMVGSGVMPVPLVTATSTGTVSPPRMSGQGLVRTPVISASSKPAAPRMAGTGAMNVPTIKRSASVGVSMMLGSGVFRVPDVQAINFKPQGMNLTSIFVFKTTTPVIVTPMAARAALPTSVVTANKLIMQNPGPVRAAWIAAIETYSGDTVGLSVWNNGNLVAAAPLISNPPFRRGAKISGQSTGFTVAQGDQLELRVRSGQASFDQQLNSPDVQLNIYKADQLPAVGSRTTDQASMTTWADLVTSAVPSGAVMDGNAFVAQFDHPEMLLAADLTITSAQATAVRILVNGVDIGITGTAGANDGRLTAAGRANIVKGDRILVQTQRTGTTGTMVVKTGSTWGIV